ncbi:MAG: imidazoleglycerol-phosphate dehydratase HisB [Anaeroplasmataceae bacterium]
MRKAEIVRNTKETKISIKLNLDGEGKSNINTGIGFFDHMLNSFAKHGLFDLDITVDGDLFVDTHHTVEDTGIALGQALCEALGNKEGIERYGSFNMCMDETFISAGCDLCGRGYFEMDYSFITPKCGDFETETVEEFFRAFANNALINLHFIVLRGKNAHHIIEAMFKSLGKILRDSVTLNPRIKGIPSTKGTL